MSSCGENSRVFSATVNEVNEIDVSGDTETAISHGGCCKTFNLQNIVSVKFSKFLWQISRAIFNRTFSYFNPKPDKKNTDRDC